MQWKRRLTIWWQSVSANAHRFRRNKYGAKKTVCQHGHKHDSKREAKRCDELHLELFAGAITDLKVHPQFWFVIDGKPLKHRNGRRVGYLSDFTYQRDGKLICEDVKGFSARDWPLRRAVFEALFPNWELIET